MTRAEILKLAREAGIGRMTTHALAERGYLERFAALVAAHEREQCAQLCDDMAVEWHKFVGKGPGGTITGIAAAIRARSQK